MTDHARGLGHGTLRKRKHPRGTVYFGDWLDANGKRRRERLSTSKRTAELLLAERIRERDLEAAGLRVELLGKSAVLEELKTRYLAHLKKRRSEEHYKNTASRLGKILDALGVKRVSELRTSAVVDFVDGRLGDDVSHATINHETGALRQMLRWAHSSGIIAEVPVTLRPLRTGKAFQKEPRRAFTDKEIRLFLEAAFAEDEAREDPVPQAPLWLCLAECGGRFGETTLSTWGFYDKGAGVLTLKAGTTKSSKERQVPVSERLAGELDRLRVVHHGVLGHLPLPTDRIFLKASGKPWKRSNGNDARRRFLRLLGAAGVHRMDGRGEKLTVHSHRDTCATRWARAGVPRETVQLLLGHCDPALTDRHYTHLGIEDLQLAASRVPDVMKVGTSKARGGAEAAE